MATKIFEVAEMACEDVQAWVKTCKFGTGTDAAFVPAVVDDGAFVVLGALADDTTYIGKKDWNVKHAFAPATDALTADEVVVIDIDNVSNGVIAGNNYKIGNKLVDLKMDAGYPVRYRKLCKGDMFWLGAGCFETAPTVGKYANLTANKVTLTPADTATDDQLNLIIRDSKPMTIGTHVPYDTTYEQLYLVEVM